MAKVFGKEGQENLINIKDYIKMIKKVDMVNFLGPVVIFIKAIIKLIFEMDMVKCSGSTVVYIKVNGKMVYSMETVILF